MIIVSPYRYRTVFISDAHLGSPHSKAGRLLAFLEGVEFDKLFLVGDILDAPGMALPEAHRAVLEHILNRAGRGVELTFIPGNHDKAFRGILGTYANMLIVRDCVHVLASGKTIFVTHGDEWDWIDSGPVLHLIDRKLPLPFWEITRKLLRGFMRRHISRFEARALGAREGHDYILCGHVHFPAIKDNYLNPGDWVKHCSAIVEHMDGRLELIYG